ncbi:MAG: phospho-N-acetylmuramoyl-pentapeptide-transferase [Candidatus Magnetoovum sp. WYHC-5]|nr:phospho-N-acetylmuramoyl-pentapeptide-transferase [Candidatus Magnetoovum sp. WYHC-5]
MFYHILYSLHDVFSPFNVFRYITFRAALSVITALAIVIFTGPKIIQWLRVLKFGQQIRDDGPKTHLTKAGTPTMGGILVIGSIVITVLLWGNLTNKYIWIMLFAIVSFGIVGFFDDYLKISRKNSKGLIARYKFGFQILFSLIIGLILFFNPSDPYNTQLIVPFFKSLLFDLGLFYIPFCILVIVGSSNAVNLTDGVDGLAIGLVGIAAFANGMMVYISGHSGLAQYLQVIHIKDIGELTVFCGAILGASLGFLWFNTYPADVFMGDVGSLGLGGALGTLAAITKQELLLIVVGGIFVIETISVILQVASYKMTKRRIFRMAPLHHHFELKGWAEPKTVIRFWIVGIILALLSLATLKVR